MIKSIVIAIMLTASMAANASDAYTNFISTLDQALSFNESVDHEFLNADKLLEQRIAENNPMQCLGTKEDNPLKGNLILDVLEKNVLYMNPEWLTTSERDTLNAFLSADQNFFLCRDEKISPKSEDFFQATLVVIINRATKEKIAFRVDWFDGDVIDEP